MTHSLPSYGKRGDKKGKNENCFNYGKFDHFARDYTEPKVMFDHSSPSNIYISSCLMLAEIVPFRTIDSTATAHIARNRTSFVEFHRISKGNRCIYMRNNASAAMFRIGSYKLELQGGRTLYFRDVFYAPKVR